MVGKTNIQVLAASTTLTSVTLLAGLLSSAAIAGPAGENVVAGRATIARPDTSTTIINQATDRAIIDWAQFNLSATETARFNQPNSNSWTLNRVVGSQDPSRIHGTLTANGNVVIVNPDGIHFGATANVDVNRLIATTSDITNQNFMSGNMVFDIPGNVAASVVNEGRISMNDYGLGAFVAPAVRNSGIITARLGQVSLASGNKFTIDPYGDGLVKLALDDEITSQVFDVATGNPVSDLVKNEGTLKADGGTVAMTAATARIAVNSVINNTGVIEANTVGRRGGKIILGAQTASTKGSGAPRQVVRVSGKLSATTYEPITKVVLPKRRPDENGQIVVTGETILGTSATIDASGTNGGGAILIGGDYLGGNATPEVMAEYGIAYSSFPVPTAEYVWLDESVSISADAKDNGDGGKVVVWSDEATITSASTTARGGANAGDGGFIETSGKYLDVDVAADASAANGKAGTWLLDPLDIYLTNAPDNNTGTVGEEIYPGIFGDSIFPTDRPSVLNTSTAEAALNAGTNWRLITRGTTGGQNGDIYILDSVYKATGGDVFANINAAGSIYIAEGVSFETDSGSVDLHLYATEGSIVAPYVRKFDLDEGHVVFAARDGVVFHTPTGLPHQLVIDVSPKGVSPLSRVNYDMSFGRNVIKFSHDNATATWPTGGFKLDGPFRRETDVLINFGPMNQAYSDRSFIIDLFSGSWRTTWDSGYYVGAVRSDRLNGIPEIITDGNYNLNFDPVAPFVPSITQAMEIDAEGDITAPTVIQCGAYRCVPTGPTGLAEINAFLAHGTTEGFEQTALNPEEVVVDSETQVPGDEEEAAFIGPVSPATSDTLSESLIDLGLDRTTSLAISEFAKFTSREIIIKALNDIGKLPLWSGQLDVIDDVLANKISTKLATKSGLGSLGESLVVSLVKDAILEYFDEILLDEKLGVHPMVREPLKYTFSTALDAGWFAIRNPQLAASCPACVAVAAATKNTASQLIKIAMVSWELTVTQQREAYRLAQELGQSAEELRRLGDEARARGDTEQSTKLYRLSLETGQNATEIIDSLSVTAFWELGDLTAIFRIFR
ncbi:MAG: filamentous hemagglutinin N-terminal domain-containing protein [Rhizobiaceae bacterium]